MKLTNQLTNSGFNLGTCSSQSVGPLAFPSGWKTPSGSPASFPSLGRCPKLPLATPLPDWWVAHSSPSHGTYRTSQIRGLVIQNKLATPMGKGTSPPRECLLFWFFRLLLLLTLFYLLRHFSCLSFENNSPLK